MHLSWMDAPANLAPWRCLADRRVALLGGMQALFEASMYTWVFLWTPALSPRGEKIPHGMVFACFMTACMAGVSVLGPHARCARCAKGCLSHDQPMATPRGMVAGHGGGCSALHEGALVLPPIPAFRVP